MAEPYIWYFNQITASKEKRERWKEVMRMRRRGKGSLHSVCLERISRDGILLKAIIKTYEDRNMSELMFLPTYRVLHHEKSWQCSLLTFRSRSTAHFPTPPRVHRSHVAFPAQPCRGSHRFLGFTEKYQI